MAWRIVPSNRKTERTPSISVFCPQQAEHKLPLDSGLPHFLQIGGKIRGSFWRHPRHRKSPIFPHPTQWRGKKKSTIFSWSCPVSKDKATAPKAWKNDATTYELCAWTRTGARSTENRLIQIYVAIPDFDIIATIRIGAHPSLVMNRRSLATKIRQRYQITDLTF